jgi:hypothetical protein
MKQRWLLAGLWTLFLVATFWNYVTDTYGAADFSSYYRAALRVLNGEALYPGEMGFRYIYPPLLAQMLAPVVSATANPPLTVVLWFAFNALLLAATTLALMRVVSRQHRLMVGVMPIFFLPVYQNFWYGQVAILLYALTVAAWAAYRNERPFLAGIMLALATWIKIYPAFLMVYFVFKREWRVVGAAFAASLVLAGFQVLISGVDTLIIYFTRIMLTQESVASIQFSYANQSILGFAQHIFAPNAWTTGYIDHPALLSFTRILLTVVCIGAWFAIIRTGEHTQQRFDLEYALSVMTALMISPSTLTYGCVSFLLPCVMMLHYGDKKTRLLLGIVFFCASFYVLLMQTLLGVVPLPALLLATPFIGGVLIWGWIVRQFIIPLHDHQRIHQEILP